MFARSLPLALVLAIAVPWTIQASEFTDATLTGAFTCFMNGFRLPHSAEEPPTTTVQSSFHLTADGKGSFTEGTGSARMIDDTTAGGESICRGSLAAGSYHVNPDGTGVSKMSWKLQPSISSRNCAEFGTPARHMSTAYDLTAAESFVILSGGEKFNWVRISADGLAVATCNRDR
jgi:hypothetical protein